MTSRAWRRRTGLRIRRASSQQLWQAVWLGVLVGIFAGLAAIVFIEAIEFATTNLLGRIAGFYPPNAIGEGDPVGSGPTRLWALPPLLALGGLAVGLIICYFAPEAGGGGLDATINAFHQEGGRMRVRTIPARLVASAITIGSGGAAGREGPTAQIGGAIGSVLSQRLGLGAVDRRKVLVAGMGAGIGAIFRAPLGGAMTGAEVLYKHDFEADAVLMALISSIVAYSIFGSYSEFDPIFGGAGGFAFSRPQEIPYYATLGVICGLLGLLYARSFLGIGALFTRLNIPVWVKPAVGGFIVGCIGMAAPEAIHVGYGWVQRAFTEEGVNSFPLLLLVLLPFIRILTTSLSVGSGGSGGVFGPGMVIGGLTGAALWRLGHQLPGFPEEPGPMVIIGMIAMFGAIAHTPLAMLLMVAEMTGNLSLLAPAMVAVAIATLLVGNYSIFPSQVETRADSPAYRDRFAFPLLTAVPAHRAVIQVPHLTPSMSPMAALRSLNEARTSFAIVVDEGHRPIGDIDIATLRSFGEERAEEAPLTIAGLVKPFPTVVLADGPLDEAIDALTNYERRWLPVIDGEGGPVLGAIDMRNLLRTYRRAVRSHVRPLSPVTENVHTLELELPEDSPIAGATLATAGLPAGVRILTISRDGVVLVPSGDTLIKPGDIVTLTFPVPMRREVFALVLGD